MYCAFKIGQHKRRRLIAAWFGIVALVLPMLAPIAQGIPVNEDAPSQQLAPFYMVLCKAMQDGTGGDNENQLDLSDCPVCLSFAFGQSVYSSSTAEISAPLSVARASNIVGNENPLLSLPTSSTHARAPPITV